jgi:hypothetical protein
LFTKHWDASKSLVSAYFRYTYNQEGSRGNSGLFPWCFPKNKKNPKMEIIVLALVVLFFLLLIGIFVRSGRAGGPKPRLFDIRCKHCRHWINMGETECPHCQRPVKKGFGLSSLTDRLPPRPLSDQPQETLAATGRRWLADLARDFGPR